MEGKTFVDGHEYVDLGFPSGVLWAACNIGASRPEEYGDYFAWGETQPKGSYIWASYKHCKENLRNLTKYCSSFSIGYSGFTDKKTELVAEDDAATANWGGKWRMPSFWECHELFDSEYTTSEWTTQNGVLGQKITSKRNGQSIFLPAAGFRIDKFLHDEGQYGSYWSRTVRIDLLPYDYEACMLHISAAPPDYNLDVFKHISRERGLTVRPVCYKD